MPPADSPLQTILFPREQIAARVAELGARIAEDTARAGIDEIALVAVADGALPFAADLMRALPGRVHFQSVKMSSYAGGTTTSGEVALVGPAPAVAGRHVLVVEDILDTGLTLTALHALLIRGGAASIRTAVLLDKPTGRRRPYRAEYVGFTCPDAFVVGYGLDFDGLYRNLPDIGDLHPARRGKA
jgi:hypoxanthine phosphoribosyltransferase